MLVRPAGNQEANVIQFRNNTQLAAEKEKNAKELEERENPNAIIINGLSAALKRKFQAAKDAKLYIEQDLLRSLRQRDGKYDNEILSEIRDQGGSEIYMMLTSVKCRAAESWISDIIFPAGDKAWSIEPTPIPDLPPDIEQEIREEVERQAMEAMQIAPGMDITQEMFEEVAEELKEQLKEALQEDAQDRSDKMSERIEDELAVACYEESIREYIKDLITYKAAIIKSPVIRREKKLKWVDTAQGYKPKVDRVLTKKVSRVSPFDIFPGPNNKGTQDGYLFERHRLSVPDLIAMKGVKGYNDKAIDQVIEQYGQTGHRLNLLNDTQRAILEGRPNEWTDNTGVIEVLEYYGGALGRDLLDWGMPIENVPNPNEYYEINAWYVGNIVFKAVLNEHPLNRRPYDKRCFEEIPGSFWGNGVPDLMRDAQMMCNGVARAMANNLAIASGPMMEVYSDRLADGEDVEGLHPWQIIQTQSDTNGTNNPAVNFHNPNPMAHLLMQVYEFFAKLADEHTGIPAYTYGGKSGGGATSTASGLSMMMTNAARGIKMVVTHVDGSIKFIVNGFYEYLMLYDEDESIKGDVDVSASGSKSLMAKEQKQIRLNEFLGQTANPVDSQIMGPKGRAALLRESVKSLDIKVDDVIPDAEEFNQQMQQAALQALPGGAGQQEAPQALDAAGNPVAGQDTALFQQ